MKVLTSSKKKNSSSEDKAQRILDEASDANVKSKARNSKHQQNARKQMRLEHAELGRDPIEIKVEVNDFGEDFESGVHHVKRRSGSALKRSSKQSTARRQESEAQLRDVSTDADGRESLNKRDKDEASEYKTLMHKAIHLLSMREHSIQELCTKLLSRTEDVDSAYAVMDFLKENDYVSDHRFTEAFVRARANKGQGPTKIRADLKSKGVSTTIIDDHLDSGSALWFDNASSLYVKKYGDEPVSDYNTWSKRARFLQSRGFTMDQIQATVPQVDYD